MKEEIEFKNIFYIVFDLGRRNIFFVFDFILRIEVLYIIKYFYGVSIENIFVIISLGNSVGIKLEEIN